MKVLFDLAFIRNTAFSDQHGMCYGVKYQDNRTTLTAVISDLSH